MLWAEFSPYILPYVMGCPDPVVTHHVRLAAIEFCRRTACWQVTMDPLRTFGTHEVELEPDTGAQVNKVRAVAVAGRDWPLTPAKQGWSMARSESPQDFCFTSDNLTLQIYPLQASGLTVLVDAALVPTLTATALNDAIAQAYMQDIAWGAIASIQRVPGQSFSDLNASALMQAQFNARIATVAAKVSRGFMAGKMPIHTSYL